MVRLTRGERFKDARTVHNQHKKQTMDEVAAATGISKSLIQALEDDERLTSSSSVSIIEIVATKEQAALLAKLAEKGNKFVVLYC